MKKDKKIKKNKIKLRNRKSQKYHQIVSVKFNLKFWVICQISVVGGISTMLTI